MTSSTHIHTIKDKINQDTIIYFDYLHSYKLDEL